MNKPSTLIQIWPHINASVLVTDRTKGNMYLHCLPDECVTSTNVHSDSRMNSLDFGDHESKVEITATSRSCFAPKHGISGMPLNVVQRST